MRVPRPTDASATVGRTANPIRRSEGRAPRCALERVTASTTACMTTSACRCAARSSSSADPKDARTAAIVAAATATGALAAPSVRTVPAVMAHLPRISKG